MAVIATDDYNRANGGLGANWTTHTAWAAPQIASNAIPSSAGVDLGATYTAANAGQDDMYAKLTVIIGTQHLSNDVIVMCRMKNDGTDDCYYFDSPTYGVTGGGGWTLQKSTAGVATILASNTTAGTGILTGTHTIEVRAVGTTITGYIDGALIATATDATHSGATKRYGGLHLYSDNSNFCTIDNFEMGTIVGAIDVPALIVPNPAVTRSYYW